MVVKNERNAVRGCPTGQAPHKRASFLLKEEKKATRPNWQLGENASARFGAWDFAERMLPPPVGGMQGWEAYNISLECCRLKNGRMWPNRNKEQTLPLKKSAVWSGTTTMLNATLKVNATSRSGMNSKLRRIYKRWF